MMAVSPILLLFLFGLCPLLTLAEYPDCWVRTGECLDSNEGPLTAGVTPQKNPNVVGDAVPNVASFDDCAEVCFNNEECRSVFHGMNI